MSRIDLSDLTNLQNESTATGAINANNETLEEIMDNALFRNGESPNHMLAELDMNSNPIINLPAAVNPGDAVRVIDLPSLIPDFAQGQLDIDAAEQAAQDAQNAAAQAINAANSIDVGTIAIQDANAVAISGGTISNTMISGVPAPQVAGDLSNKQYADKQNPENARVLVRVATAATLPNSPTYTAATSTTTAILEASTNGSLAVDGVTVADGDRVLVKDQATALHNDVYTKSTVASHWKLIGASDVDISLKGEAFYVNEGSTNAGKTFSRTDTTPNYYGDTVFVIDNADFATRGQLDVTNRNVAANTAAIANVNPTIPTPTPTTLGGVKSLAVVSNQFLTSIGTDGTPTQAQPSASNISGLATSATTDTTNASNISGGTLPDARLSNVIAAGGPTGDSSHTPIITWDAHGRLTAVSSAAISGGGAFTTGVVAPGINSVIGSDTTDKTTIASVISGAGIITFYPGTYLIDADTTWPAGKIYRIHPGAQISVSSGKFLTISGRVESGPTQIFIGSGTVRGISSVRPEWFGGSTASSNNSTAITAAIACAEYGGGDTVECEMIFGKGTYKIGSTITFHVSNAFTWHISGAGPFVTDIQANASFSGTQAILFDPVNLGGFGSGDFILTNLAVRNADATAGPSVGIQVGSDTIAHNSIIVNPCVLYKIYCAGFTTCFYAYNMQGLRFNECLGDATGETTGVTTGGSIFKISAPTGKFCGDIHFTNCQAIKNASGRCIDITDRGIANVGCAGIGFEGMICYGANSSTGEYLNISATGSGSSIGDIWLTGPRNQFEGPTGHICTAVQIVATGGGEIHDVHVKDVYFVGNGWQRGVRAVATASSSLFQIFIQDNWFNGVSEEAVFLYGTGATLAGGGTVSNNQFRGCGGGSSNTCVYTENFSNVMISNNIGHQPNTTNSFIQQNGGNWISILGNTSGGSTSHGWLDSAPAQANIANNI